MGCGYKKVGKKRKKRKYDDFNEYDQKYSPRNRHYKGTKGRKFESLASEIIEERQDKQRRKFMRAEKRLKKNKMASMRTRQPNFSEHEGKKCPKGYRRIDGKCQKTHKGDPKTKAEWRKRAMDEAEHNRKSWNPVRRIRQKILDND